MIALLENNQNEDGSVSKSNTKFSLGHRIEFRNYENESTDDNWRYRLIGKVAIGLGDKLSVWGKVQPRWTFGQGQEEDTKIDDIKKTEPKLSRNIYFSKRSENKDLIQNLTKG